MSDRDSFAGNSLLDRLGIHPVLVDLGAAGGPPAVWAPIASRAVYVGFDPGGGLAAEDLRRRFREVRVFREAVAAEPGAKEIEFFVTRSPHCSSALPPDAAALDAYLFADLFEVASRSRAPAVTIGEALDRVGLSAIDWFKADTQGTDLRLFESIPERVRRLVLAVDTEPGLLHAYRGEDLFVDVHRRLLEEGFFCSRLDVLGNPRIGRAAREALAASTGGRDFRPVEGALRRSPGWCEARYLRTPEALADAEAPERPYVLLWAFAILDDQPGFALDVALAAGRRSGSGPVADEMKQSSLTLLRAAGRKGRWRAAARGAARRIRGVFRRLLAP